MSATITVKELLLFLLALLGIGLLVYLIRLVRNANKFISKLNETFMNHELDINDSLEEIPKITSNVTAITDDLNQITGDLNEIVKLTEDDITAMVHNASSITDKLDKTSDTVFNSIENISDNVSDTVASVGGSVRGLSDYILFFLDIVEIVKKNFSK